MTIVTFLSRINLGLGVALLTYGCVENDGITIGAGLFSLIVGSLGLESETLRNKEE